MKLKTLVLMSAILVAGCSTFQYDNGLPSDDGVATNPAQARVECQNSQARGGMARANSQQYMNECMQAKEAQR